MNLFRRHAGRRWPLSDFNNEDLLLLSNFLKQALRYMYVINNLEVALKFCFLSSATADSYSFLKYLALVALKRGK